MFYDTVAGLTTALRDHPKLPYCLVNRLYAYGTGGPVSLRDDRDVLTLLTDRFAQQGYKLPELLREIALSNAFTRVRASESVAKDAPAAVATVAGNALAEGTSE